MGRKAQREIRIIRWIGDIRIQNGQCYESFLGLEGTITYP